MNRGRKRHGHRRLWRCAGCLLGCISVPVWADDNSSEPPWSADAELGLMQTTGNTSTSSVKAKLDVSQELPQWRNEYTFDGLYARDKTDDSDTGYSTSAQRWFASAQGNYKLDEKNKAVFIYGSYEQDRFSGYQYQGSVALGYANRLLASQQQTLDVNIGPGVAFNQEEQGDSARYGILRLSASYKYKVSPTTRFSQTLSSDLALDAAQNSRFKSETALRVNINSTLALKTSFAVSHNTQVDEGVDKTDTQTAVTLVYTFK